MVADASDNSGKRDQSDGKEGRCELDLHANMVVMGKHCIVVEDTGRKALVNAFTPEYDALDQVPIVDAAVLYECPYSGVEYLLIF